jgi:hypothetical protein
MRPIEREFIHLPLGGIDEMAVAHGSLQRRWTAGMPESRERDHLVIGCEQRRHVLPHPLASHDAVEEQHGFTGSESQHG